ncbi:MAG: TetR/AcrR family transcriptional regulator [Rubrivivax sp.]|nr:TetR/AcrR family transcriptional regulator [Rubrivivax sp.]
MSKPAARKSPDHLGSVRFSTYIEASALELGKGQRGERSRLKLMAAGARLLDRCSFQDLKIEDVSVEAGLAKGTFYIYFASKDEFLRELATAYFAFELNTLPHRTNGLSRFGISRLWIGWYERTFAVNAGILRCVVQMGVNDGAMRDLWLQRNAAVVQAMLSESLVGTQLSPEDLQVMMWALRTVGGMLDQSLFDRYGLQTPSGLQDPGDADLLVEMHSVLAYRALYGMEPPAEEVEQARSLLHLAATLAR